MRAVEDPIRRMVSQQAADWYVANQEAALTETERAAFVAWLKASPIHVEEYLGVALISRDLRAAADDPAASLDALLEQARADDGERVVSFDEARAVPRGRLERSPRSRRWLLTAAAAASVVLMGTVTWWTRDPVSVPVAYATAHGEQGSWRLPDGSLLRLNTDSEVTVRYSRRERVVEIARGQALFEVAHDAARRFRVAAGPAGAIAVGTQFDVYRNRQTTVVTTAAGRVAVYTGRPPALAERLPSGARLVEAGHQLRIDDGVMAAHAVPVDVDASLAWVRGKIEFERRPLGEVAEEFNRYAEVPLDIEDADLRALPISGLFDTDDMGSFVAFLQSLDGVVVQRTPARIRVHRLEAARQESATTPL
jgi:transmembrane sensor